MARDSNGIYSLPAVYLATNGATIQPEQHNTPLEDLASAMTGSLPRNGSAPMTAPITLPQGTVSAPSMRFSGLSGTGVYWDNATSQVAIAINGVKVGGFDATGIVATLDASNISFTSPYSGSETVQNMLAGGYRMAREFDILPSNSAAQNTIGFNAMIGWLNSNGGYVLFQPDEYTFNGADLNAITANTFGLIGQGDFASGTVFRNASASGNTITLTGAQHGLIHNIYFKPSVFRNPATREVLIQSSSYKCTISRCRFDYCANAVDINGGTQCEVLYCQARYLTDAFGVRISGTNSNRSYRAVISNFITDNPYPQGYGTVKAWGASTAFSVGDIVSANGKIWQCVSGGTSGAGSPNSIPSTNVDSPFTANVTDGSVAWRFVCSTTLSWIIQDSYAYSVVIDKAALINGYHGFTMADGSATGSSFPIWCWADGLETDHAYGEAVLLSAGEGFYAAQGWFGSSLAANGVTIGASHKGEISFGSGTRIAANWLHGVSMSSGPVDVSFVGCFIGCNSVAGSGTYHGVYLGTGVTDVSFSGCKIGKIPGISTNNQGYGLFADTGTSDIRVDPSVNFKGNVTGRITAPLGGVQGVSEFVASYADDAAASAGGVPIGGIYRTTSTIKVRTA